MSVAEKLAWIEALWDSVSEAAVLHTPESQLKLIRARLKEMEEGSADMQDADEFLNELEREFK